MNTFYAKPSMGSTQKKKTYSKEQEKQLMEGYKTFQEDGGTGYIDAVSFWFGLTIR